MKPKAKPVDEPLLRVISLGGGVQSTTMCLMAAHGEIGPMPDAALFSDPGSESAETYRHLAWLAGGNVLPFPVQTVEGGDLAADLKAGYDALRDTGFAAIPYFIQNQDGTVGLGRRACTGRYKIAPLQVAHKAMLGIGKGKNVRPGSVEVWIGISMDEVYRMRPSRTPWQVSRFPLIEKRMTRADCIAWLKEHEYPVPVRSSCTFCPFHSDAEWARLRDEEPDAFAAAVDLERTMQEHSADRLKLKGKPFLHRSCRPLGEVAFMPKEPQPDLFGNDCDGLCGV